MSELINNREYRQQLLKEVIMELHRGKSVDEVKEKFKEVIEGISPTEISNLEQSLISEGLPIEDVQRLCSVHAAVFRGSIEEIHHPELTPGHPVHTFKRENREIEKLIEKIEREELEDFKKSDSRENINKLLGSLNLLYDIDKHYKRKENLIFPYLEKYGITAPPKVMWGVDDEIRNSLKEIKRELLDYKGNKEDIISRIENAFTEIKEMISKEEEILFPMCLDTFTEDEWYDIYKESDEIGFCLIYPDEKWKPTRENVKVDRKSDDILPKDSIHFDTGVLKFGELNAMLNTLPFDITFIDKDDVVKYFTHGKRIFARPKTIIGRNVANCHPPASVHVVEKLISDFKSGKKDHEDFWIKMGDLYVYIRYFAVRDREGNYLGTMEITQDIKPIQEIKGEKRLLSE